MSDTYSKMLAGKIILITGSSSGIGAATARLAQGYGAEVILHGREESENLKTLAAELGSRYVACDVADEAAVRSAVQGLERIDALVNCAGITDPKGFMDSSDEDWLNVFKVNVLGTVHFCKAVIPVMQKAGQGRIVNISSIRGYGITSRRPAYSASKAAVINLTASLAKEFAPNIAVNAVAPGFTETGMAQTWSEEVWKEVRQALVGRVAQPAEIGEMICFLASDKASFITGQTFLVDGGYSVAGK